MMTEANVNAADEFEINEEECYRNSYRRCSLKKVVLRNFAKFTG